jgi:hypothetical protein
LFAGARDRRVGTTAATTATPSSPSVVTGPPPPSSLPTSPAPPPPPATRAAAPSVMHTPPASSTSSVVSSPAINDDTNNPALASSGGNPTTPLARQPSSMDIRQQSLESKLASDMEHARDRAVHLAHTWLTQRQSRPLPADIQASLVDDWLSYGSIPGEKLVMRIEPVQFCRADMAYNGTLVMTSYQIYFEPVRPDPKLTSGHPLGGGKLSIPLSTIERIDVSRTSVGSIVCTCTAYERVA